MSEKPNVAEVRRGLLKLDGLVRRFAAQFGEDMGTGPTIIEQAVTLLEDQLPSKGSVTYSLETWRGHLAAAREEGRREGRAESEDRATICMYCGHSIPFTGSIEAVYEAGLAHDATCERNPHLLALRAERAAHAAQLVALREAAWALADGERIDGHTDDCTCGYCETAGAIADAIRNLPLPDAEAALEKIQEEAVREADTEDTPGPCTVRKIDEDDWELWCENPGTGEQPNGRRQLASFGTYAECRAVCNALNRVVTSFLNALGGGA